MQNSNIKPNKVNTILGWTIGLFFLLFGILLLFSAFLSGVIIILAALSVFPLFWRMMYKKWNFTLAKKYKIILFVGLLLFSTQTFHPNNNRNSQQVQSTVVPTGIPTVASNDTMAPEDKMKIVSLLQQNLNHFKQIWQDGNTALGTTQYPNAEAGLEALNDPSTDASKFSEFKQKENPALDNSYVDTIKQVNPLITTSNTTDKVSTWSDGQSKLTADMSQWVNDATGWQISSVSTTTLNADANVVNHDFVILQNDIQAINN